MTLNKKKFLKHIKKSGIKILIFDIETSPLAALIWSLGKQVVRSHQLIAPLDKYNILTIAYKFVGEKTTHALTTDLKTLDSTKMLIEFDKVLLSADIVIGKNSDNFDIKRLNGLRLQLNLPPLPPIVTDDVQKQFKKHFSFPSQALDYLSKIFGFGGKNPMEFKDWVNIVFNNKDARKSLDKMVKYNKKDVQDTESLFLKALGHINFNVNKVLSKTHTPACKTCGSTHVVRNGTRFVSGVLCQSFLCNTHNGHAGHIPVSILESGKPFRLR